MVLVFPFTSAKVLEVRLRHAKRANPGEQYHVLFVFLIRKIPMDILLGANELPLTTISFYV